MNSKIGNPGPIGLMGFAMTTILLNIHNAGFTALDAHILAMGIFVGGVAQIIAGIIEMIKGKTFPGTAFTLYGFFWLALVYLINGKHTAGTLATFLLIWGLFSVYMFIGTFRINKALQVIFGSLVVLFILLAVGNYLKAANIAFASTLLKIAGFEGILCGAGAFYLAMAEVLNELYGKEVLPIGTVE